MALHANSPEPAGSGMSVHFIDYLGPTAVTWSQTTVLLDRLARFGCSVHLHMWFPFTKYRRTGVESLRRSLKERVPGTVNLYARPPLHSAFQLVPARFQLSRSLRQHDSQGRIIHCRGPLSGALALGKGPHDPVVADFRGVMADELTMGVGNSRLQVALSRRNARWVASAERDSYTGASMVCAVSSALLDTLRCRFGPSDTPSMVFPTCFDAFQGGNAPSRSARRQLARADLMADDRFVIAYVGSFASWQGADLMVRLVSRLASECQTVLFLVISSTPDKTSRILAASPIPAENWRVLSLPHDRVQDFLVGADMALLMRNDSIVNRVASPTKFAEYLAAQVPVAVHGQIGDIPSYVDRYAVGGVVDPCTATMGSLTEIISKYNALHADSLLHDVYDWDANVARLLSGYRTILGSAAS